MINSKGNANEATVLAANVAKNMHYEPNLVGCSNALKNSAVVCMSSPQDRATCFIRISCMESVNRLADYTTGITTVTMHIVGCRRKLKGL